MSAQDDTTTGQPVNYQTQCPHCSTITVIPADKPYEYEDDYCGSCGESFYTSPEAVDEPAATAFINKRGQNTGRHYGTWSGAQPEMKDHIALIVPITTVQRMYADGPQLIGIYGPCADAQSAAVREAREKQARERQQALRNRTRSRIAEEFDDEIQALEDKLHAIWAKVDAKVDAVLDGQQ